MKPKTEEDFEAMSASELLAFFTELLNQSSALFERSRHTIKEQHQIIEQQKRKIRELTNRIEAGA